MCQAVVYLSDEEIMREVVRVEPLMEGVHQTLRKIEPGEVIRVAANEEKGDPGFYLETIHRPQADS